MRKKKSYQSNKKNIDFYIKKDIAKSRWKGRKEGGNAEE